MRVSCQGGRWLVLPPQLQQQRQRQHTAHSAGERLRPRSAALCFLSSRLPSSHGFSGDVVKPHRSSGHSVVAAIPAAATAAFARSVRLVGAREAQRPSFAGLPVWSNSLVAQLPSVRLRIGDGRLATLVGCSTILPDLQGVVVGVPLLLSTSSVVGGRPLDQAEGVEGLKSFIQKTTRVYPPGELSKRFIQGYAFQSSACDNLPSTAALTQLKPKHGNCPAAYGERLALQ